ncbi:flagellar biosynthesis protein FlhF [Cohnella sp. 56]|uniref:flagellar biosynthesis protein FlhF n=1 Tax=Cohnella sp. 56 TaxID=3113722 RepID=UPI0030E891C7
MKVKRYLVDDLPQAVQQIRSELGSDAVILNTKEIRTGGFLGMFRKKRVEVIAAVDESAKPLPQARPAAKPAARPQAPAAPRPSADRLAPEQPEQPGDQPPLRLPASAVRQRYGAGGAAGGQPAADAQQAGAIAGTAAAQQAAAARQDELPAPSFDRALAQALTLAQARHASDRSEADAYASADRVEVPAAAPAAVTTPAAAPPSGETAELLAELRAMKDLLRQRSGPEPAQRMPEPVLRICRLLALQGVEPAHVEAFAGQLTERLRQAGEEEFAAEDGDLRVKREAQALLQEWLAPARDPGISRDTRIVHFVGPTGVGKTTTIAKLGAEQTLSRRRSVGFITADTYRIAAVDQLRTYADILNVPLEVVFSPSELARAYKKLEDRDLLLMDTAGRNYRNELYVSEVNSLLSPGQEAEKILVLSLTHKYQDMRSVSSQFVKYGVSRLLLTKMDETDSYGAIVNLIKEYGFTIPYVTFGQTVPDDIRPFDPEWLAAKLLEGAAAHD